MLNKFSKAGYHNKFAIKYGEIFCDNVDVSIENIPIKKLIPYTPPSPKKFFPKKFKKTKTIKKIINILILYKNKKSFKSLPNKYKKNKTIKKFSEHRLLTPSIKLYPLINTNKKKDKINILKKSLSIIMFKKLILKSKTRLS
tara:strand:+ start:1363 stop:1788 length:426 start_codon:yes stop_codon:yes gene_type:complete